MDTFIIVMIVILGLFALSIFIFMAQAEGAGLVWRAINKAGSSLFDIADVSYTGCSNGQVLKYQTSNSSWICASGYTKLNNLDGGTATIVATNTTLSNTQATFKTLTQGTGITLTDGSKTVTVTNNGVTSLTGTANNVTVSASTGSITLNTGSNVVVTGGSAQTITKGITANSLTLGGSLNANSLAINNIDVTSVTGATTLSTDSEIILVNPSTTAFTITLPDATGNTGKHYRFLYVATTGTVVTIDGDTTDTINGRTTVTMKFPNSVLDIYSDGTNWYGVYSALSLPIENDVIYVDDCISSIGTSTVVGAQCWLGWTSVGTGTETGLFIDGEVDHLGIKRIGTTATSGDDHDFFLGSTATLNLFDADDTFDLTFIIRPSTAITAVTYRVGANLNTVSASELTSENAMFLFDTTGGSTGGDTTHWVCRTRSSGGTDQTTATTSTVNLNQWYNLRVLKDSGTIRFLIDDVNVCNHSTQIPSGVLSPFITVDTSSAAARSIDFDYFRGEWTMSGR